MADNIDVTPGTGKTVATDDVTGVQYQVVKLDIGGNGASSPVTDLATEAAQTTGNSTLSTINGKITAVNTGAVTVASSALPTGAATAAKQPALGTAGTSSADVITVQGIASGTPMSVNASNFPTTVDTNTGNSGASTQRVVIATDQPNLTTAMNTITQPTATTNSLVKTKLICAGTTNATSVKGSAGKVYKYRIFNADTVGYFVKFYNKATAPTVGTDVPVETCFVPPFGGYVVDSPTGDPFTTGIAFATTLLATDADTTVVTTANKLVVNLQYI